MKIFSKRNYSWVTCWMLLMLPQLLAAQNEPFRGGEGSGISIAGTGQLICSITQFSGGGGNGFQAAATGSGLCNTLTFSGGNGSGSNQVFSTLLNCNNGPFSGDSASGVGWNRTTDISCSIFRFAGDSAGGNTALETRLTNCNDFRFAGDTGSGYRLGLFIRPRDFLGNDTAITIICSEERYNLLQLYRFEGITLAWSTPTPDTVFTGNFRVIGTTTGGCLDTAFALIQQEIAVWNGSVSNNWHTAANWNNQQVPGSKTHVIIPANTPNPCVISQADAEAVSVQGKINGNFNIINNRNLLISGRCAQVPSGP